MHVIGTAGHVDHGKSTLIEALTGTHPDRLKEERDREMTIDLGFAWFNLPDGAPVGVVDVPGHRDFIENMLAGIGSIDAVLLVIAADEGVMPQTREHLAIIDLLNIHAGLIVLTKCDLVDDADWFDLVEADIMQLTRGTIMEKAPIIHVSARSKHGLDELSNQLQVLLSQTPQRLDYKRPRLPIDRIFTLTGFGTVVTGTLLDGTFNTGDAVEILPGGIKARIRGLQTFKQQVAQVMPGARTAVNLSGVHKTELQRGQIVTLPGLYQPSSLIDVSFKMLADATLPLKHNSEIKLFIHATEVIGKCRILGAREINPGDTGWLQLVLQQPIVTVKGDHFILRKPSPGETLGGGVVVDPFPRRQHRANNQQRIEALTALLVGTPEEILLQTAEQARLLTTNELIEKSKLPPATAGALIDALVESGDLVSFNHGTRVMSAGNWGRESTQVLSLVAEYHQAYPLKVGMPREQAKSKSKMPVELFELTVNRLVETKRLKEQNAFLMDADFKIHLAADTRVKVDAFLKTVDQTPYAPPGFKIACETLGEDVSRALLALNELVLIGEDVIFRPQIFDEMQQFIIQKLQVGGTISLAEVRDHFTTSRKYAVAVLEYLDAQSITIRDGDVRRLRKR